MIGRLQPKGLWANQGASPSTVGSGAVTPLLGTGFIRRIAPPESVKFVGRPGNFAILWRYDHGIMTIIKEVSE
jgi:hypothetical protein